MLKLCGLENTWWGDHFCSAWVEETIIKQQIWYLLYGFSLKLYNTSEYIMIYWFLQHSMHSLYMGKEYMKDSVQKVIDLPSDSLTHSNVSSLFTNGIVATVDDLETLHDKKTTYILDSLLWSARRILCLGAIYLLAGIGKSNLALSHKTKLWTDHADRFTNQRERYRQRFRCFDCLTSSDPDSWQPRTMTYEQYEYFLAVDVEQISLLDCFKTAMRCYKDARNILAKLKGIKLSEKLTSDLSPFIDTFRNCKDELDDMERIAVRNGIATRVLLERHASQFENVKINLGFESHRHYFTVSISSRS